jgi:hypothetical protein
MSKAPDPAPADEVPQWPLVLGLCLLALSAFLTMRLGHTEAALVIVAVAVVIPIVGIFLRSVLGLGRPKPPRIRRVIVREEAPIVSVQLETAKYLAPAPQPSVPAPEEPVAGV